MPTPPNATATVPVTAVRLDAPLKARIAAAQGDLAREMPGLSPTFSDAVRVLINEALDARAARAAAASPPAAHTYQGAVAAGLVDDDDDYDAAMSVYQAACDDEAVRTAFNVHLPALGSRDPATIRAAAANIAARAAAVPAPTGRGAGGVTLHRATNGASVATVVANDPK